MGWFWSGRLADRICTGYYDSKLSVALFGGIEPSEPSLLRAESLGWESLGWRAQRAAPGPRTQCAPRPSKGVTTCAEPGGGLSGLEEGVCDFNLRLRSLT